MKKIKIVGCILSIVLLLSACEMPEFSYTSKTSSEIQKIDIGDMFVSYIDVGQGDCELITLPGGTVILIDGGDTFCSEEIVPYLNENGVEKIDILVATHPHADHIGGLDDVLNSLEVDKIYLPKISNSDVPTTVVYERFLTSIKRNGCAVVQATDGLTLYESENILVKCLGPMGENYGDLNAYSAVIKIEYGECSFLFTGDATQENEREILRSGENIDVDVLKVGHHGSGTSTTNEFLEKTTPKYAIISVGVGNRYGHPHNITLDKLEQRGIKTYRTDKDGTVVLKCDGNDIEITTCDDKIY